MSRAVSPSVSRHYGLARVCRVWKVPRSTFYHRRNKEPATRTRRKRGPKTPWSDAELVEKIRDAIDVSPWVGEGHRKVWARLRYEGVRVSRKRVLRLMRENDLLAPSRAGKPHGPKAHDGTIIAERPDRMWGTDTTRTLTGEGNATVFLIVDHCTAECLGIHAARPGTRFEALEPLRQAVVSSFGEFAEDVALDAKLELRHDHGSQFVSDVFQDELHFLGIESSPTFVREPEGNGCAERFIRTLKEQLLWLRWFETVEELREALHEFRKRYNAQWLIERHGHRTPSERRRDFTDLVPAQLVQLAASHSCSRAPARGVPGGAW